MSDTDSKARHETLRERLAYLGFVGGDQSGDGRHSYWSMASSWALLPHDPAAAEYDADCDAVEVTLAPYEQAYRLGQRDGATPALAEGHPEP